MRIVVATLCLALCLTGSGCAVTLSNMPNDSSANPWSGKHNGDVVGKQAPIFDSHKTLPKGDPALSFDLLW